MNLPVSNDYLAAVLHDNYTVGDVTLRHHRVGDLQLPTGQLVACDPLTNPDRPAFTTQLPPGTYPVILAIAQIEERMVIKDEEFMFTDESIAFSVIRLKETSPVHWNMMTLAEQETETLEEGEFFGYPVDAGMGCFMDHSTALLLSELLSSDEGTVDTIIQQVHGSDGFDMKLGEANSILFRSGYGDGSYPTYAGIDAEGEIAAVVTDFWVMPEDDNEE